MSEQLTYYESYKQLPPRIDNQGRPHRKKLVVSKWIGVKKLPAVRRLWLRILDAILGGDQIYWRRAGIVLEMRRMAKRYTVMNDPSTWYVYVSVRRHDGSSDRRWRVHLKKAYLAHMAKYLKEHPEKVFEYKHTSYK